MSNGNVMQDPNANGANQYFPPLNGQNAPPNGLNGQAPPNNVSNPNVNNGNQQQLASARSILVNANGNDSSISGGNLLSMPPTPR